MHYLQKRILDTLRHKNTARYSELLPAEIESSHFRYHLKQLEKQHYVTKRPDTGEYALSLEGKIIVDYLSVAGTNPKRTPKVITYTLLTHGKKLLLYRKDKEPYKDMLSLIGGKVHFGEDVSAAAQREVFEKMNWKIGMPKLMGIAEIKIREQGDILSHVTAYVHYAEISELPASFPEHLISIGRDELHKHALIPDLEPLLSALDKRTSGFILELNLDL